MLCVCTLQNNSQLTRVCLGSNTTGEEEGQKNTATHGQVQFEESMNETGSTTSSESNVASETESESSRKVEYRRIDRLSMIFQSWHLVACFRSVTSEPLLVHLSNSKSLPSEGTYFVWEGLVYSFLTSTTSNQLIQVYLLALLSNFSTTSVQLLSNFYPNFIPSNFYPLQLLLNFYPTFTNLYCILSLLSLSPLSLSFSPSRRARNSSEPNSGYGHDRLSNLSHQ